MEWFESLLLGVVQGITEFLPVSSDGHLVITQQAFAWLTGQSRSGEENLFFDIMLHVGTLAAILFITAADLDGAQGIPGRSQRRAAGLRPGVGLAGRTAGDRRHLCR